MLKDLLHKNYLIYGSSILFTRGLEYAVLLYAAHYLSKSDYGELEYYKKVIEVGSSIFAFGFPALILSYTRSKESKSYFFLLGILFVLFIASISAIFFTYFNWSFLIIPFIFYALFFTGGIAQSYFLVSRGSNYASYYKIVISILFYAIVFISINYFDVSGYAYVWVNYILLPLSFVHAAIVFYREKIIWKKLKRYWGLFKKLLLSSLTLVVSNFANMMFLYTDIFIIKVFSDNSNIDIANYSFSLNIANMLMLIPLTLVQVDIEKLKNNFGYVKELNKKIVVLVFLGSAVLIVLFYGITNYYLTDYKDVFLLFTIILTAKIIQAFSPLYGSMLIIMKKYKANLYINLSSLLINIVLSYVLYQSFSLYGIAFASVLSLIFRQILLYRMSAKSLK